MTLCPRHALLIKGCRCEASFWKKSSAPPYYNSKSPKTFLKRSLRIGHRSESAAPELLLGHNSPTGNKQTHKHKDFCTRTHLPTPINSPIPPLFCGQSSSANPPLWWFRCLWWPVYFVGSVNFSNTAGLSSETCRTCIRTDFFQSKIISLKRGIRLGSTVTS